MAATFDEKARQRYIDRALELHHSGYNCAQSVVCALSDLTDMDEDTLFLDEDTLFRVAEGFGGGMGGFTETCGALSGAVAILGLRTSGGTANPKTKARTYARTRPVVAAFREKNGTTRCPELKGMTGGPVLRPCDGCIEDACNLLLDAVEAE